MSKKTVFISYRRDSVGKPFSQAIKKHLTSHGYDAFLDVGSLGAGNWEDTILAEVERRAHFLLLLTPGALNRCSDANDMVRREYLHALAHKRNIIPILEDSQNPKRIQKKCPQSMEGLFSLQCIKIHHASMENDIKTLLDKYIAPHNSPKERDRLSSIRLLTNTQSYEKGIREVWVYAPEPLETNSLKEHDSLREQVLKNLIRGVKYIYFVDSEKGIERIERLLDQMSQNNEDTLNLLKDRVTIALLTKDDFSTIYTVHHYSDKKFEVIQSRTQPNREDDLIKLSPGDKVGQADYIYDWIRDKTDKLIETSSNKGLRVLTRA